MIRRFSLIVIAGLMIAAIAAPARAQAPGDFSGALHSIPVPDVDLRVNFQVAALGVLNDETGGDTPADLEAPEKPLNRIGLFLGATSKSDGTAFAFGGEYERRLIDLVGIGIIAEWTPAFREPVLAAPTLYLHPFGDLSVILSPGVEFEEGGKFLFRIGLAWDFDLGGGFSVAPTINYDIVADSGDAIAWGVVTSYSF